MTEMKPFLTKAAASASAVVLFCLGCVLAGIGLSVVALLAVFALAAAGVAVMASPFLALAGRAPRGAEASQPDATL